jgi:benzoate membrane transport protein
MRLSVISSALVAALVGTAGTLAVVLAAAQAVGATPVQTTSWVMGLALAMAASSIILSAWHRIPIITAWSTPGAAIIAATSNVTIHQAVGAFLVVGALIVLTALVKPLSRLIERIPVEVAAAMLAGVLVRFVLALFDGIRLSPELVLPLIAVFLVLRTWSPANAMLAVMGLSIALAFWSGAFAGWLQPFATSTLTLIEPVFDPTVLIGLAVPLYLVTMASQNLPGGAVMRAAGYTVPMASCLTVTGLASIVTAPVGAHTVNLAAITAAICTGPDAHPDADKRWQTGIAFGVIYMGIAAFAGTIVALFTAFPAVLIKTVVGLGLIGALTAALGQALQAEPLRFAAVFTFVVTASGITVLGVGSAFWGLVAGLIALSLEAAGGRRRRS